MCFFVRSRAGSYQEFVLSEVESVWEANGVEVVSAVFHSAPDQVSCHLVTLAPCRLAPLERAGVPLQARPVTVAPLVDVFKTQSGVGRISLQIKKF